MRSINEISFLTSLVLFLSCQIFAQNTCWSLLTCKQAIFQCHINFTHLIDSSWLMEVFLFHLSFSLQGQDNWKKMFSEEVMLVVFKKIVQL